MTVAKTTTKKPTTKKPAAKTATTKKRTTTAKTTTTKKRTTTPKTTAKKATLKATHPRNSRKMLYTVPGVRGIQARGEYYTAMLRISDLNKMFNFSTYVKHLEELEPRKRHQRMPQKKRINAISEYVLESERYTFSSITILVDPKAGMLDFRLVEGFEDQDFGYLSFPVDSDLYLTDGQHRVFGLLKALKENDELRDETISVTIYYDLGVLRRQQVFHDQNQYAIKPNKSINLLYDHVDPVAGVVKDVVGQSTILRRFTELESTTVSKKAARAFTLNAIDDGIRSYLYSKDHWAQIEPKLLTLGAKKMFDILEECIPTWGHLKSQKLTAGEIRATSVACHAIAICGFCHAAGQLILKYPSNDFWAEKFANIPWEDIDFSRTNPEFENLIIFGGSIRKNKSTCKAFGNWILAKGGYQDLID